MGEGEGIEAFKSLLKGNLFNNGRILLIANNPVIPDYVFATLDINANDIVVVFNKVIHQEKLSKAREDLINGFGGADIAP